jgi:methylthioribose-1-phosphate isomerase
VTHARLRPASLATDGASVRIIDQRALPAALVERDLRTLDEVVDAIATLAVRGAPAIGVCAVAGVAVAMRGYAASSRAVFLRELDDVAARVTAVRPTAVNLAWAVARAVRRAHATDGDGGAILGALQAEAHAVEHDDVAMSRAIGQHALQLLDNPVRALTHCNTGALATAGGGTALAAIYAAHAAGRDVAVYATETRPLLQGARLTAWELQQAGVPVTVLADGAAASLLRLGTVTSVLVGADRIAANGDVANKIGTYALALAAATHGVPFYVLAPKSTVDADSADGRAIPIELRAREELARCGTVPILPDGVAVWNPAFDITPASLVTAIVTDSGVHRPPYRFADT